jgi:hypothetical protein
VKYFLWLGSIRSITTLIVVGTFCYLAIDKTIDGATFAGIVTTIVAFYFMAKDRESPDEKEPLDQQADKK